MFPRCAILIALILSSYTNLACSDKNKDTSSVRVASNTNHTKIEIKTMKTVKYVLEVIKPEIQKCSTNEEAVNVIEERLGAPDKTIYLSGISDDIWYLDNNAYLSALGLRIVEESGNFIQLRQTSNKISENIIQTYSMCTLPLPAYNNNSFWIGSLDVLDNGTYLFRDAWQNKDAKIREGQENNYFMKNPVGKYTVEYLSGLRGDDLLENLKSSKVVAKLIFISSATESKEAYFLYVDIRGRDLRLKADQGNAIFKLNGAWQNNF